MTFTEALSAVFNDGDRVTRQHWNNRQIHITLDNYLLSIYGYINAEGKWVDDGKYRGWIVSEQDYFATDWEVLI